MELLAFFLRMYNRIRRLWLPPRPEPGGIVELAPPPEEEVVDIPLAIIEPPAEGHIELDLEPPIGSNRYRLNVALRPGDYAGAGGQTMLFLRSRTGTDAELPISSLTIHYMVRASITILPGHGAEYTLYCIPTPDGEKPVYVVPGPLTRVTIWNLEEERDPAGVVLQWSVTVNGAPPERCMYANDTLNIEGFEADLNGMVTITLTAN